VDFVESCNVCAKKAITKAAKRILNSDKMCRSYNDLNFGVTFWNTVYIPFFFAQPTCQTPERILTHNIPKRAESCKVQTFSG